MDISTEKDSKLENAHKKMRVIFTGLGILSFALGAIVNYYTIKRITK